MYTFWSHLLVKRATLSFVRITYNHRVCILLDLLWKASPSLLSLSLSFSLCVSYGTLKGGAIKTADPRSVLLVRTRNDDRDHVFLLIRIYFSREMSAVMRDRWTSLEHPLSLSLSLSLSLIEVQYLALSEIDFNCRENFIISNIHIFSPWHN